MITMDQWALLYGGTPYRKTHSCCVVEIIVPSLQQQTSHVYFFDTHKCANAFIRVNNRPPYFLLFYDLGKPLFNQLFDHVRYRLDYILNLKQRFKIGSGARGDVYVINHRWVIKQVYIENDGVFATYQVPDHFRSRLALPLVNRIQSDVDKGFIVIEKLYKINPHLFDGTAEAIARMNDPLFFMRKGFKLSRYLDKDHPLYPTFYTLLTLHRYLRWRGYTVTMDVTYSNIMVRRTGEIILNDAIGAILPSLKESINETC